MDKESILNYVMETPGNSNRAVLNSMLNQIEGDKLPSVNEEDNGKVLTVVEGEWAPATASGGGGSAPLKIQRNDDGNGLVLDKTWQEISDAFPNAFLEYAEDGGGGEGAVIKAPLTTVASVYAEEQYQYMVVIESVSGIFSTDSPTGYPSADR